MLKKFLIIILLFPFFFLYGENIFKIVPAKGKVIVDGVLSEWDKTSGYGPCYLDEELKNTHSVIFYSMYDKDNLYLAAEVKDPDPMRNEGIPEIGVFWHGDSITFRFCLSPEDSKKNISRSQPEEASKHIFHLSFWHNHRNNKDYVLVKRTFKFLDQSSNEIIVKFKKWKNSKGYTMEAKVPWKVLDKKVKPVAGDRIRWTMDTIWGNFNCDMCMFKTVALGNAANYTSTDSWGWAEFVKKK